MKPRMLILLVVAAALGIFFATRASGPADDSGPIVDEEARKELIIRQTLLSERELPGEEPAEDAELAIRVEVDPTGEKNRLYYYISEAHGYYVETFNIDIYHVSEPGGEPDAEPVLSQYVNDYLKANETLRGCFELVPTELKAFDGQMGDSENWYAEVTSYGRAREKNPEPLPLLSDDYKCR